MQRRHFFKFAIAGSIATVGFTRPTIGLASRWPSAAFEAKSVSGALHHLYRSSHATPSTAISIAAPIQSTGRAVPITVESVLKNVDGIAIVVEGNPYPLSTFVRTPHAGCFYRCHIRMAKSSAVTAYLQAGGKLYSNSAQVKISVGGFGMHGELAEEQRANRGSYDTKVWARKNPEGEIQIAVLVGHPMGGTTSWRDKGVNFSGKFIKSMSFYLNGELAAEALFGPNVATNPVTGITLPTAKAGDMVVVKWYDSTGMRGGGTAQIT